MASDPGRSVIGVDFFRDRTRVVNRISIDYTDDLQYGMMCTYQGELFKYSSGFLPERLIYARAAFLLDSRLFTELIFGTIDLDLALVTGIPEIQARALSMTSLQDQFEIFDPQIIPWTPQLIGYYTELIRQNSPKPGMQLVAGFLQVGIIQESIDYHISYFLAETAHLPAFTVSEKLEQHIRARVGNITKDMLLLICIEGGYFPPWLFTIEPSKSVILSHAFRAIQPELVRRLKGVDSDAKLIGLQNITRDKVRRAGEMIRVVKKNYPDKIDYLIELKVICGQPFDWNDIRSSSLRDHLPGYLRLLAHPQFRKEMALTGIASIARTSVYYDLINYFREEREWIVEQSRKKFTMLCACGQLLRCYGLSEIRQLAKDIGKMYLNSRLSPTGNYREILEKLRS